MSASQARSATERLPPGPSLRSSLMGIQIHGYLTDEQWNRMLAFSKDLGMGWIKVQVQWKELEPAKGNFNELYKAMTLNVQRARLPIDRRRRRDAHLRRDERAAHVAL